MADLQFRSQALNRESRSIIECSRCLDFDGKCAESTIA